MGMTSFNDREQNPEHTSLETQYIICLKLNHPGFVGSKMHNIYYLIGTAKSTLNSKCLLPFGVCSCVCVCVYSSECDQQRVRDGPRATLFSSPWVDRGPVLGGVGINDSATRQIDEGTAICHEFHLSA